MECRIGYVIVGVKALEPAVAFYRDTMGLETTLKVDKYNDDHPEEKMLIARAGEVSLIFFERESRAGRTPIVVFTLGEGGIDNLAEKLAAKGVHVVVPVSEAPGGWTTDFLDPDGHVLSFYQSEKSPRRL